VLLGLAMLYLAAKPSHVGVDVDKACLPPALSYCPLTDTVLLCLATKILLRVPPPMLVHTLLLSDKGKDSSDGTILSYRSVRDGVGFRPQSPEGERDPECSALV
jgi:hypothetical protein